MLPGIGVRSQASMPAFERTYECEHAWPGNRTPKAVAINQNARCRKPINATCCFDHENSHATGAKPINKILINISRPATMPKTSTNRALAAADQRHVASQPTLPPVRRPRGARRRLSAQQGADRSKFMSGL